MDNFLSGLLLKLTHRGVCPHLGAWKGAGDIGLEDFACAYDSMSSETLQSKFNFSVRSIFLTIQPIEPIEVLCSILN
jgi:hypothetical protein